MLLNSVIIVLREALEAALMISVLLALSRILRTRGRWVAMAFALGLVGAFAYEMELQRISDLFGGVGHEVVDASMQFGIFLLLVVCFFITAREMKDAPAQSSWLPFAMAAAVIIAMTREGSEVLVYLSGFWQSRSHLASVGAGSVIGACIGLSVGILFYYLLVSQPAHRSRPAAEVLLCLIGAGMCVQATGLLIQADWVSPSRPLWDSSAWLPEDSITGQLLYALLGYEASPTAVEVAVYTAGLLAMAAAFALGRITRRSGVRGPG